jgi:hypothetical protein
VIVIDVLPMTHVHGHLHKHCWKLLLTAKPFLLIISFRICAFWDGVTVNGFQSGHQPPILGVGPFLKIQIECGLITCSYCIDQMS